MNFTEAYRAITEGKKVKQLHWDDGAYVHKDVCCTYNIDAPCVVDEDGDKYIFDAHDYRDAWELYEEKPKLHTFEEAIVALKEGRSVKRKSSDWKIVLQNGESKTNLGAHAVFLLDVILANDWEISE